MKRILALLLSLVTLLGLAACGTSSDESGAPAPDGGMVNQEQEAGENGGSFFSNIKLEKVGKIESGNVSPNHCGLVLTNGNKKAIASFDGKRKTDYKYDNAKSLGEGFFEVNNVKGMNPDDLNTINATGVVKGANAKEVLPMKYALAEALNERYVFVIEAKGVTESKEESLFYLTKDLLTSLGGSKDTDVRFTGVWHIYDSERDRMVPKLTGTLPCNAKASGEFINYRNEQGKSVWVDESGKEVEGYYVASDGSYTVNAATKIEAYDAKGKKLFAADRGDYSTILTGGDYYRAGKTNGKYVVLNKKGKEVSKEFDGMITVCGEIVLCGNKVYDFEGNQLIDGEYTAVELDPITKNYYILKGSGKTGAVIDGKGKVLYSVKDESTGEKLDSLRALFYKEEGNNRTYYSYASASFKHQGGGIGYFMIAVSSEDKSESTLINVLNNETLLEGYRNYQFVTNSDDSEAYVYAFNNSNGVDIYKVK